MDEKKKFYEKGWFTVLMLFLFSPVGIFLLWKHHRKHKILNVFATIVFGIPFLFIMIAIFSPSESFEERSRRDQEQRDIAMDNSIQSDEESQEQYSDNDKIYPDKSISLVQTYTNEDEGFAFRYPNGWNDITDMGHDNLILLLENQEDPTFIDFIEIVKFSSSKNEIEELFSSLDSEFERNAAEGAKLLDLSDTVIDGVSAKVMNHTSPEDDRDVHYRTYYYTIGATLYRIQLSCVTSQMETSEPVFDAIMDSYRITRTDEDDYIEPDGSDTDYYDSAEDEDHEKMLAYTQSCDSYEYRVLEKDSDKLKGSKIFLAGRIAQIDEKQGSTFMRVEMGPDTFDFVAVIYEGELPFYNDDEIEVYGEINGFYSYTSNANIKVSIPRIDAKYCFYQGI